MYAATIVPGSMALHVQGNEIKIASSKAIEDKENLRKKKERKLDKEKSKVEIGVAGYRIRPPTSHSRPRMFIAEL